MFEKFFTIKRIWDGLPVFSQETIYRMRTEMRQSLEWNHFWLTKLIRSALAIAMSMEEIKEKISREHNNQTSQPSYGTRTVMKRETTKSKQMRIWI